jgi:ankyrin repeat protein
MSTPDERLEDAADSGDVTAALAALRDGADANFTNRHGGRPLWFASVHGHAAVMRALLAAGADASVANYRHGRAPLHNAAQHGHTEAAQVLLEAGASIDCPDKYGWRPLFIAAESGHLGVVNALLGAGADPELTDARGKRPVDAVGVLPRRQDAPAIRIALLGEMAWRRRRIAVTASPGCVRSVPR